MSRLLLLTRLLSFIHFIHSVPLLPELPRYSARRWGRQVRRCLLRSLRRHRRQSALCRRWVGSVRRRLRYRHREESRGGSQPLVAARSRMRSSRIIGLRCGAPASRTPVAQRAGRHAEACRTPALVIGGMSLSGSHAFTGRLRRALALGDGLRLVTGMSARRLRRRPSLPSARTLLLVVILRRR